MMHSSPSTPMRSQYLSVVNPALTCASPQGSSYNHQINSFRERRPCHSRTSSLCSGASSLTTGPMSLRSGLATANGLGNALAAGTGLGSLADELAEAWDEEGETDADGGFSGIYNGERELIRSGNMGKLDAMKHSHKEEDADVPTSVNSPETSIILSSAENLSTRSNHHRQNFNYDGSEYDDSNFEDPTGICSSLEARLAAVESLARRRTESNGSEADIVVQRVAESLKNLGSQSRLEQSATRINTTHTALASHIVHETRILQALSHPLFSPLSIPPESSSVDELLPLLSKLYPLPAPDPQPLLLMLRLHSSTTDLLSTLSCLSDSLHMMRQTSLSASRRLRAAKELVDELRREADAREEGVMWVEKGRWNDRLAGRECGRICRDVVGGFEEVCNEWREKMASGAIGNCRVGVKVVAT